jgi:hypothetical protein
MSKRTDITDLAGTPRAIAELNREELRALRALADAGMIPPLDTPLLNDGSAAPQSAAAPHAAVQGLLLEEEPRPRARFRGRGPAAIVRAA